ncbi:MAG: ABC transporter permease [Atopobiaceae bacterium]|jgi:ABC-type uncharacterized transport system permease subunit
MGLLNSILADTIYHSVPIIFCVIGGVFAYKANVLNIALEGMMLIGAFVSTITVFFTGNMMLGLALALLASLAFGLIFSVLGVTFNGNVIVIGLAINLLASAIPRFVMAEMGVSNITLSNFDVAAHSISIPIIEDIPILGPIVSGHPILAYVAFIGIPLMWMLSYRTRFGTYVRVVGENEDAAKSLGIRCDHYKYLAILIGAACCALAGVNLSTEDLGLFTNDMTASRGFIAIAAIYCGRGDPALSAFYAILFGFARSLAINLAIFAGPVSGLFDIIPYILMVVVLTGVSLAKRRNVRTRGFQNG